MSQQIARIRRCKRCAAKVHRFRTEIGRGVEIDAEPLGVLADISAETAAGVLWEWHGPHVRWLPLTGPRTWRPVYREHDCPFAAVPAIAFAAGD